jgi:RND family efflux transporter MFP subunit
MHGRLPDTAPPKDLSRPVGWPRRPPWLTGPRLAVAVGVVVALLVWAAMAARGPAVNVVAARQGSIAEVVYATGIVEPVNWAKVTAPQRKRIVDICRCEGQAVRKGDVLVRLDDVEEQALLAELQWRLARYREDAERLTGLVERNITSRVTLDDKLTQVHEYEARVAAQKNRISDLALKSPIDGEVLRRDGEVGEIAGTGSGDTLIWVGSPRPLQIVAEVNEADIVKVAGGQTALLRHEGHAGGSLKGTVERITPKGDAQTKTFRVYIRLADDTPLRIGMSVEANIVVAEVASAVLLPAEAIADGHVLAVADDRAERRPVTLGLRGTSAVEVKDGVAAGDLVVSPFAKDVTPGSRVRPREAVRP